MRTTELVRVLGRQPQAGEVLHRRERVGVAQAEREGAGQMRGGRGVERPRSSLAIDLRARRPGHVRDRREVGVDAEAEERGAGPAAVQTGVRGRARAAGSSHRRQPRDRLHRAALLVDPDQQRRLSSGRRSPLQRLCDRAQLCRRGEVEAMDDHAADLAAPRACEKRDRGRRAGHRDDELLPDELGERRLGSRPGRARTAQRGDRGGEHGNRRGSHIQEAFMNRAGCGSTVQA